MQSVRGEYFFNITWFFSSFSLVAVSASAPDVTKFSGIDTCGFALKTQYNTEKSDLEKKIDDANKKIPDIIGLVKK